MTDERETRLQRAMDETTESGAISHYLADKRAKAAIADDLATEHVEGFSTPWLTINRETSVGE